MNYTMRKYIGASEKVGLKQATEIMVSFVHNCFAMTPTAEYPAGHVLTYNCVENFGGRHG